MKKILKEILPPFLVKALKPTPHYGWFGSYKSWNEAQLQCTGYNAENILEKVRRAVLKVKNGEAVYERDSVLFDTVEYSWPLLSSLMWIAATRYGRLNIADFGGSLGSSYFQNKKYLDALPQVNWNVVEQESFVKCGREDIQDARLQFFYTIDELISQNGLPDAILISCALPYLEQPYALLEQLMNYKAPYLLIDNTLFNYKSEDRVAIQRAHPEIYKASYPCWMLNYNKVVQAISKNYVIVNEYFNEAFVDIDGKRVQYRGLIAKSKLL